MTVESLSEIGLVCSTFPRQSDQLVGQEGGNNRRETPFVTMRDIRKNHIHPKRYKSVAATSKAYVVLL